MTFRQALDAVCTDLRQYPPQILLICEIVRVVSGNAFVEGDTVKKGIWIAGGQNVRWLDGPDLIEYVCDTIRRADPDFESLAAICARVFQSRAFPDVSEGRPGIWLETGMEDFHCRQCGQCCQALDYHNELAEEDVARWRELGRTDILDWVGVFKTAAGEKTYRIWMTPGTMQLAETCPFLKKRPSENLWDCRIHDVKPGICSQYPVTRKHGIMTGCPGFGK